jgi:hypothetical protein
LASSRTSCSPSRTPPTTTVDAAAYAARALANLPTTRVRQKHKGETIMGGIRTMQL